MYIEKEKILEHNSSSESSSSSLTNSEENKARWNWLISGWDKMTFKERMALFIPYMHYVNTRNNYKYEFDAEINFQAIETAYKTCRMFRKLKFDPDGQGTPNIIMVFDPIDIRAIPDATTRSKVEAFGIEFGFIHSCCTTTQTNCNC